MCPKQPQNIYRVYRNLNNGSLSIKNKNTGRVAGYADEVWINNPRFIVSEAGRQRVLRECRKNVHAYIEGTVAKVEGYFPRNEQTLNESGDVDYCSENGYKCSYNPYNHKFFYDVAEFNESGVYSDIHSARLCHVNSGGVIRVWS